MSKKESEKDTIFKNNNLPGEENFSVKDIKELKALVRKNAEIIKMYGKLA